MVTLKSMDNLTCEQAGLLMVPVWKDDPGVSPPEKAAFDAHLAACPSCTQEYADTCTLMDLISEYRRAQAGSTPIRSWRLRRVAIWAGSIAACWAIALACWWLIPRSHQPQDKAMAAIGQRDGLRVERIGVQGRSILDPASEIRTLPGEVKTLAVNGMHSVTVNEDSAISIEPLTENSRLGCLVRLARGEVYIHVEHDGNPFVVKTPHGRAVITGTTFEVKTTNAGTTLVVSEGSVRFESEAGAVQVLPGYTSMIAVESALPSNPVLCDAVALTAWVTPHRGETQVAQDTHTPDSLLEGLPLPSPWGKVQTDLDLEAIDYSQWVEDKQVWFKGQFPWIFELKDAFAKDGVTVDYPALLIQSGNIWQFRYPKTLSQSIPVYDSNSLVQLAARYGRDRQWLETIMVASRPPGGQTSDPCGVAAFEEWTGRLLNRQTETSPPKFNEDELLPSQYACWYLATTRTLAILGIRQGFADTPLDLKAKVLGLLQDELQILGQCAAILNELGMRTPSTGPCDYLDKVGKLIDEIKRLGELDGRITEYEKDLSQ